MRVAVTGADGFIGWHLRCRLHIESDVDVVAIDREGLLSQEKLRELVQGCDAVVHLAGMNRGDESEIARVNPDLARRLVEALEDNEGAPSIIYSSSIHADLDSEYGISKRRAGEELEAWSDASGAVFSNVKFPHVFGEHARPFYNSVVATFCRQLVDGDQPRVQQDGQLELLHVQEAADLVLGLINRPESGEIRPTGTRIKVGELLRKLQGLYGLYRSGIVPSFDERLDLDLFNTLRSYMFPRHYPIRIPVNSDNRGSLFEAVKTEHGGQAFLSTTHPGITRGNHFHFHKLERFLVVGGEAVIRLRRLFDDDVVEFKVSGEEPCIVDMPTLHTHSITNTGSNELLTLFWAHEIFDPESPDTFGEPVLG